MPDLPPSTAQTDASARPDLVRPAQIKVPFFGLIRELPRLLGKEPALIADLVRATAELAIARVLLARRTVRQLGIPDPAAPQGASSPPLSASHSEHVRRVGKAIAIAAPRVPWRSDCLVQSLAGRRWLAALGIPARISIGVKHEADPGHAPGRSGHLLAHAWLSAADTVVTGGDVGEFSVFVRSGQG